MNICRKKILYAITKAELFPRLNMQVTIQIYIQKLTILSNNNKNIFMIVLVSFWYSGAPFRAFVYLHPWVLHRDFKIRSMYLAETNKYTRFVSQFEWKRVRRFVLAIQKKVKFSYGWHYLSTPTNSSQFL